MGLMDEFDYILVLEHFSTICQPKVPSNFSSSNFIQLSPAVGKLTDAESSFAGFFVDGFLDAGKLALKFYYLVTEAMYNVQLWES